MGIIEEASSESDTIIIDNSAVGKMKIGHWTGNFKYLQILEIELNVSENELNV